MLEQILAWIMSYAAVLVLASLLILIFLELVHIGQVRRLNKRQRYVIRRMQRYLDAVFTEEEETDPKETEREQAGVPVYAETARQTYMEAARQARAEATMPVQVEAARPVQSRQEQDMRAVLKKKKNQRDGELLDSVLQEIFD